MKLARVEHIRCNEYDGTQTLVWIPDDMTKEELDAAAQKAAAEYMAFAVEWAKSNKLTRRGYAPSRPQIAEDDPDTLTVGEIRARHEIEKKEAFEHATRERKAYREFAEYLQEEDPRILRWWENLDNVLAFEVVVDWGHNHGIFIDYSEIDIDDLPGPLKRGAI